MNYIYLVKDYVVKKNLSKLNFQRILDSLSICTVFWGTLGPTPPQESETGRSCTKSASCLAVFGLCLEVLLQAKLAKQLIRKVASPVWTRIKSFSVNLTDRLSWNYMFSRNFVSSVFARASCFFCRFRATIKICVWDGSELDVAAFRQRWSDPHTYADILFCRGGCGKRDTASAFGSLTWRLWVCGSWGLQVGLPPGSSSARRRRQRIAGRQRVLPLPGLPIKGMERMEVDQCAGAAGGAGGGALRRSNSAPMITSVRSVQLHPGAWTETYWNKCLILFSWSVGSSLKLWHSTCKEQWPRFHSAITKYC